jgi:hypothetical protein
VKPSKQSKDVEALVQIFLKFREKTKGTTTRWIFGNLFPTSLSKQAYTKKLMEKKENGPISISSRWVKSEIEYMLEKLEDERFTPSVFKSAVEIWRIQEVHDT